MSTFVPRSIDATDFDAVAPLFDSLLARPVESPADLERWLADRSELDATCAQSHTLLHINTTCDTGDTDARAAFLRYIEQVPPRLKPRAFELDRRQASLFERFPLPRERYEVLSRDTRAEVELFRAENVPLETELDRLTQEFEEVAGAMTVEFDGREQTLPQMGRYQESNDRAVREAAWRVVADRRMQDADRLDSIYDRMVSLRDRVARNAGLGDYIGWTFKSKKRFDYTPEDCREFHRACAEVVAPFVRRQDEQRRRALGVPELRPWDLAVDPMGREPLRPFEGGADLMRKCVRVFERLDPALGAMLASLGDGSNRQGVKTGESLDLDSRKGKAPGGYQAMRDRDRKPFIFMNAAGLSRDAITMLHEAGHAFHSLLCASDPLVHYRHSPIEFAEVASMSMELLTMPHWGGEGGLYPNESDLARATRSQLEDSVFRLPWIATIDAFQHWIYKNPGHTHAQREAHWLELDERFGRGVSWSGLEKYRPRLWQRQLHLFSVPMYYVEYGIAQLGALQLWLHSLEKGEPHAVSAYKRAMSLGGSRPLPDLFKAAGLTFDFGPETVRRLVARIEVELSKLPL